MHSISQYSYYVHQLQKSVPSYVPPKKTVTNNQEFVVFISTPSTQKDPIGVMSYTVHFYTRTIDLFILIVAQRCKQRPTFITFQVYWTELD